MKKDPTRVVAVDAEDCLDDLAPAAADEAGKGDDLPGPHLE